MQSRAAMMAMSVIIAVFMLFGKSTAYLLTGSAAILADAVESAVHLITTGFAAFSLWYASQPADEEHPYGHGRIAFFSAGAEGALVTIAAISVMLTGIHELIHGVELNRVGVGLAITIGLALVNVILGMALIRVGRRTHSVVLVANGHHVLTDVYTTAAATIGLTLVMLTGIKILDPLAAIAISFIILVSGFRLVRTAYRGLMDELDPTVRHRLMAALHARTAQLEIGDLHHVRARLVNDELWVEFHARVPGAISVEEGHQRISEIEQAVAEEFTEYRVHCSSHLEPFRDNPLQPGQANEGD